MLSKKYFDFGVFFLVELNFWCRLSGFVVTARGIWLYVLDVIGSYNGSVALVSFLALSDRPEGRVTECVSNCSLFCIPGRAKGVGNCFREKQALAGGVFRSGTGYDRISFVGTVLDDRGVGGQPLCYPFSMR